MRFRGWDEFGSSSVMDLMAANGFGAEITGGRRASQSDSLPNIIALMEFMAAKWSSPPSFGSS